MFHVSAARPARSVPPWRMLVLLLFVPLPARSATLTVLALPAGVIADNATEAAVLCAITDGYPDNLYAVKGTFSPGELPYYGLTFNPGSTLWASQRDTWSGAQMRIQTDARGSWRGYMYVRLETSAPRGAMLFRFSAVPLSPISLPGPTVSEWYPIFSLDRETTGGWLCGHVYRDPETTIPAEGIVVRAEDSFGRLLGSYASQNSFVVDGEDRMDRGFVRIGVPIGRVARLTGHTRAAGKDGPAGTPLPLYVRYPTGWTIRRGSTVSFDSPTWGDADGDGTLTAADAVETARIASGIRQPDPDAILRGDVWPPVTDGLLTVEDAICLLRCVVEVEAPGQPPS